MNFYFMPKYFNNPIENSKHPVSDSGVVFRTIRISIRFDCFLAYQAVALRTKSAACWWSYYGVYFCSGQTLIPKPKCCNWKIYDDVKLKQEWSEENLVKSGPNWQEIGVVGGAYAVHSPRMGFIVWFHVSESSSFLFIYRELARFRRFFHSLRFALRTECRKKGKIRIDIIRFSHCDRSHRIFLRIQLTTEKRRQRRVTIRFWLYLAAVNFSPPWVDCLFRGIFLVVPVMMLYNHATDGSNFNSDLISQQNVTRHGVCCYIDGVLSWSGSDFEGNNARRKKKSKKSFAREMRRHGWILDKTVLLALLFLAEVKNSFVHPHCGLKIGANCNVSDLPFKSYVKSRFCLFLRHRLCHQTAATFYRLFMTQKTFRWINDTTHNFSPGILGSDGGKKMLRDSIMRDYDAKMFVWLVPFYLWSYKFIYISSQ